MPGGLIKILRVKNFAVSLAILSGTDGGGNEAGEKKIEQKSKNEKTVMNRTQIPMIGYRHRARRG
jgi:hypothetical protein